MPQNPGKRLERDRNGITRRQAAAGFDHGDSHGAIGGRAMVSTGENMKVVIIGGVAAGAGAGARLRRLDETMENIRRIKRHAMTKKEGGWRSGPPPPDDSKHEPGRCQY